MGENVRQPQDAMHEPTIYALQKKQVALLPANLDLFRQMAARVDNNPQFQNNIVQTVNSNIIKREVLKRKSVDDEEQKPKNAKVTSDSISEEGDEIPHPEYCINPIKVVTNGGELTLVERNKVSTPEKEALVLIPPQHPLDNSDGQSLSIETKTQMSGGSVENMDCSNDDTPESSGGSDNCSEQIDENKVQPLHEEISKWCSFDNLQNYLCHFEHAYNCDGFLKCHAGSNCSSQRTKKYVDEGIEKMRNDSFISLSAEYQHIFKTLFHHSMSCQLPSAMQCPVPQCGEFKEAMEEILQRKSSYGICNEIMDVVFSNNSVFNSGEDGCRSLQEGEDFQFLIQEKIGQGSFGYVYDSWLLTRKSQFRMVVKKVGNGFSKGNVKLPIDAFVHLSKAPYLLFPDVILKSRNELLIYMIMEKGEMSLRDYIREHYNAHCLSCKQQQHFEQCNGGLNVQLCSSYFYQMSQGLKYLHGHGYTHGDIKTENVVVMPQFLEVKLIDFDSLKREDVVKRSGTLGYMAPEVLDRQVGNVLKSSDVYSLCCCLPEMLLNFNMYNDQLAVNMIVKRSEVLFDIIKRLDGNLAIIFQCGIQPNYQVRPSIDKIVECFERNAEMRERKTTVDMDVVRDVDMERDKNKKLSRKILDYWISEIMDSLPRTLIASSGRMDIPQEDVENIEDVSLQVILQR